MKAKKNYNYDHDYKIKNGRLINDAPDPTTGLWKAAQRRKAIKRAEKVSIIVEANQISKDINEL